MENVVLRRSAKRSVKEDLAIQQLNTGLVNAFKSGRGTGWNFSIGKITQSGTQVCE